MGPDPATVTAKPDGEAGGRGIVDTGCGTHPWLDPVVDAAVFARAGKTDPADDPERGPDQLGPLDGVIDGGSGHGTFVAGPRAPDRTARADRAGADRRHRRSVGGAGPRRRAHRARWCGWRRASGSTCSTCRSATTTRPRNGRSSTSRVAELLLALRRAGVVVVCSAGNDSTDRPLVPGRVRPVGIRSRQAARRGSTQATRAPLVSVGALNPNGTVALFSNVGPWVQTYAPGAAVLSTFPSGRKATVDGVRRRDPGHGSDAWGGLNRETIDPDDFSGGFAIWSGTSFAAPAVAGMIAAQLQASPGTPSVARAREAVAAVLAQLDTV